jgi:C-terminal processing protease CtpA/Prc
LSDSSGLRLTTALYYTPSNYQIQDNGLMPDIIFESEKAKEEPEEEEEEPVEEKMQKFDPASDPMVRSALGYLKSWNIWGKNLFMERNKESSAK